jgi:hypothetical protein
MARELGYKILSWGIGWMHCKVKNNVCVIIDRCDPDLFVVYVVIEDHGKYYYGPHRRKNLKENIEEFIKGREEDIKLRKTTKRSL